MIVRACAYNAVIHSKIDPTQYTKILVTFAQDQEIIGQKTEDDLIIDGNDILVSLSQDETLQFRPSLKSVMGRRTGSPAYMQVRLFSSTYDAPGSKQIAIEVVDSQSEEVLVNA